MFRWLADGDEEDGGRIVVIRASAVDDGGMDLNTWRWRYFDTRWTLVLLVTRRSETERERRTRTKVVSELLQLVVVRTNERKWNAPNRS